MLIAPDRKFALVITDQDLRDEMRGCPRETSASDRRDRPFSAAP
jgi:hypothetical protein